MNSSAEQSTNPKARESWKFRERWRIEGVLVSQSPFHLGSGEIFESVDVASDGEVVEISECVKNYENLPMIPGAALKGNIRAWLQTRSIDTPSFDFFEKAFGKKSAEEVRQSGEGFETAEFSDTSGDSGEDSSLADDQGWGGTAEFADAHMTIRRAGSTPLPYWSEDCQTWIETTNSIRRDTRTAADQHLIHKECVPAGIGFDIIITGMLDEDQVAVILAGLNGFNDENNPVTIGADTASGKGIFRWEPGKIYRMDEDAARKWVTNHDRDMAEKSMPELGSETLEHINTKVEKVLESTTSDLETFDIILNFESHFLVNDPSVFLREKGMDSEYPITHNPRVDEQECPVLPAKSFRGALRSQAEKILRTLAQECARSKGNEVSDDYLKKIACHPNDRESACKPIQSISEKKNLCMACRLFGASGWKTPIRISDFEKVENKGVKVNQHFVAIDRFTGGGKTGAKFSACAWYKPSMKGRISMKTDDDDNWCLGLLALVLRDLMEGDITFGFGASKGYGSCKAEIPIRKDSDFQKKVKKSLEDLRKVFHKK